MSDDAAPPTPAGVPAPTGDARVDAVLARLRELAGAPVAAHVEVFEDVHARLQELLGGDAEDRAADRAADPAAAPRPPLPRPPAPGAVRPVPGPRA
ncbi:hypothetical protein [Actinomadura atramentaria]|uniref:hypothetical protein n=1 Tax=Actinomadura atramentaria TaxID=1990 RepID=UPI00036C5A49|nr:hypothetical protein [Actinomadura atramentaria]